MLNYCQPINFSCRIIGNIENHNHDIREACTLEKCVTSKLCKYTLILYSLTLIYYSQSVTNVRTATNGPMYTHYQMDNEI